MKARYGADVKVGNDIGRPGAVQPDDVTLVVKGEDVLLTADMARKLAKKLKKHARKVELSNTFRAARQSERGYL